MDTREVYSSVSLVPVAVYALAPTAPTFATIVLIALTWSHVRHALARDAPPATRFFAGSVLPLSSLVVGSSLSLLLSNPSAGDTLSSPFDTFVAMTLFAFLSSLPPLLALVAGAVAFPGRSGKGYTALLVPALLFALAGIVQEKAGFGRVGWWVQPLVQANGAGWVTRVFGQVGADVLLCASAVALAEVWSAGTRLEGAVQLTDDVPDAGESTVKVPAADRRRTLRLLAACLLVPLVGPLVVLSAFEPSHPTPDQPRYTYPPLKVACVVPPNFLPHHGHSPEAATLDDWLAETTIVAGRGVKILSWSEGAVKLPQGAKPGAGGDANGDEEMGADEISLLSRVGEVCDMYKVYVLATYIVPSVPSASLIRDNGNYLNVATLVGPRITSSHLAPRIVWSTRKHHAVPFVESFAHARRSLAALGSVDNALPLAEVQLPHARHTPSPHLTPLQRVSVSGAICQDVAFPSLVSSYAVPSAGDPPRAHTPQLLLNPSRVPPSLPGLAHASLAQECARALEHGAFALRCAAGGGPSILVGPDGDVRVMEPADENIGSWEAEIAIERASSTAGKGGTWFEWIGRTHTGWIGAQGRWWLLFAGVVGLVRLIEGGEAIRWTQQVRRADLHERTVGGLRSVRGRLARILGRESSQSMDAREEEALIHVD